MGRRSKPDSGSGSGSEYRSWEVALPRATLPNLKRSYLGAFTLAEPVDYESPEPMMCVLQWWVPRGPGAASNRVGSSGPNLVEPEVMEQMRSASSSGVARDSAFSGQTPQPVK